MTRHLRTEVPFPAPFDAAFLARIARPLQVVLAGGEVLYDPARAAARARAIPDAMVSVVEGAGHLLPMERPADVAGMIL